MICGNDDEHDDDLISRRASNIRKYGWFRLASLTSEGGRELHKRGKAGGCTICVIWIGFRTETNTLLNVPDISSAMTSANRAFKDNDS